MAELGRKHGEHGAKAMFAARVKTSPSFVYQVVNGHRGIGDKFARKIEAGFHLGRGQVDGPLEPNKGVAETPPPYTGGVDPELLADVLAGVEEGLEGRQFPPDQKAKIAVGIYEMFAREKTRPSRAAVVQFVRRVA